MKTNPNDTVNPTTREVYPMPTSKTGGGGGFGSASQTVKIPGLTKREYFAAMALQGMLGGRTGVFANYLNEVELCVQFADTLIKALNKE